MTDWAPFAERIESAAVGGPIQPIAALSHIMQGAQATMIAWARERPAVTPVSAHFTIGKTGRIVQHVSIRRQAWHAGRLDIGAAPTWRLLPPGGNPNDFAVGIEHEGFSGEVWPELQIEATIRVHRWLFDELKLIPSTDTVIGHFETAPRSRAHDPGPTWPRGRILEALHADRAPVRLTQVDYETAALNAFFGVLQHRYTVREDENWQYIEIRRPRP